MKPYEKKMNQVRAKAERAIALLQSAHKTAYRAEYQFRPMELGDY